MKVLNWNRKIVMALVASGAVAVATPGISNADEILTFDSGLATNADLQGSGYGNNLPTTPNVTIDWNSAGWDQYNTWDGRGAVGQLDYNGAGGNVIEAIFSPDAGFGVFISGFELDEFVGGGNTIVEWNLVGTGFSGTWDEFSDANAGNGGRTLISTGMSAANAVNGPLTLSFTRVDGLPSYIAVDNIAFGQVTSVPEPASASVLSLGIGALLLRRRKS